MAAAALLEPRDVRIVGRRDTQGDLRVGIQGRRGAGVAPVLDLGVAVGEQDASGPAMIAGGIIHDAGAAPAVLEVGLEQAVVDAVLAFVNEHPSHGGRWPLNVRVFPEDDVLVLADVHVEDVVHPAVHGHAADARQRLRADARHAAVGGAVIDGR